MNPNLEQLFTGKFYIHEAYGLSLVPALISSFTGVSFVERKESDLINKAVVTASYPESVVDAKTVAVITFNQPVIKYTNYYWLGTQSYISILERFKNDDSIAGVVMSVDSGGGQVYGTPEFYEYIKSFSASKPLVVYTGGLLCSGAYYFAAGASWIVAHSRADAIGSIGVYTVLVNFDGVIEKLGGKVNTIYSSLSEDKNQAYRAVMDGTDGDYKNYIKKEIDPIAESFIADMKAARPGISEEAFKGGTWTGDQSVAMGLVDENGTIQTAIAKVFELAASDQYSNNSNNSNMTKIKSYPKIQELVGIEGEGLKIQESSLLSGKKGVFLSETEADSIETELAGNAAAITAEKEKVTEAEGKVTTLGTAVDAAIKDAGLESEVAADASTEEKITLLSQKVVEYGKKPASATSKPKAEGDSVEEPADAVVNKDDAHNSFYENA